MKRSVWSQIILGAFAAFLLPAQLAYAQSQVGVSAAVRGSVNVRSGGVSRTPLAGEPMLLGDPRAHSSALEHASSVAG